MRKIVAIIIAVVFVTACKKDPDPAIITDPKDNTPPADTTQVKDTIPSGVSDIVLRFIPVAGNTTITGTSQFYQNGVGDEFTVTMFNYYISNVRLRKKDGTYYKVPESYYLIKHTQQRDSLVIAGVPAGYYTGIDFLIGVDSLRNVSGAQSGALDVGHAMFWDWNTGYIFYKLEGQYKSSSAMEGDFAFHIGGFQGENHCLRTAALNFGSARIDHRTVYVAEVKADAAAVFSTPHDIDFDTYFVQGPSEKMFARQADNFADMFSFVSGRSVTRP